jgi:hypothetical protein
MHKPDYSLSAAPTLWRSVWSTLVCKKGLLDNRNDFALFPHILLKSHDFGFSEDKITKAKIGCYE